jgi:GT2 family glycosyltransferase
VGIASASVRLLEDVALLNSSGGAIHFLGLGWAEDFRRPATVAATDRDVLAASGAAMMMRRDRFSELGGFTEELFLYHEDAELSLRCWMHGWRVRYVADAVVHHEYEFGRNPRKLYLLERNRLILVLTCYGRRMLVAIAPALVAYEIGITLLAIVQGWGVEKVDGWRWLVAHRDWLRQRRGAVQSSRRRSDRELAPRFAERFTGAQVALPSALAPADRLLGAYWRLVRDRI